jgi:hypothetical protein
MSCCQFLWIQCLGNSKPCIPWGPKRTMCFLMSLSKWKCTSSEKRMTFKTPRVSSSSSSYSFKRTLTSRHSVFRQWLPQLRFVRKQRQAVMTDALRV